MQIVIAFFFFFFLKVLTVNGIIGMVLEFGFWTWK